MEFKETLQCSAGHAWERVRTRGRKPTECPVHKTTPSPAASTKKSSYRENSENAGPLTPVLSGEALAERLMTMMAALPKERTAILHYADTLPVK